MRIITRFSKGQNVRYISHLDLQRLFGRALRRAGVPIAYSQGYHPHPVLSFASALALGAISEGEYADIGMQETIEAEIFIKQLNAVLPDGLRILSAQWVEDGDPAPMALVCGARYDIVCETADAGALARALEQRLNDGPWLVSRRNKRGQWREMDIRPDIKELTMQCDGNALHVHCLLSSGSSANLSPMLMMQNVAEGAEDMILDVKREELYAEHEGVWIPLGSFYAMKGAVS